MNYLEEVPFKTPLGSLDTPLGEVELVIAPQIAVPDCLQTLRDTEYRFTLENRVLTGLQAPSCPPYWLMFSAPQTARLVRSQSDDRPDPVPRRRCHSLTSADARCRGRAARRLIAELADEAGYSEDDEASSADDGGGGGVPRPSPGERPRTAPRPPPPPPPSSGRLKDLREAPRHRRPLQSSSCRPPFRSALERCLRPGSPLCHGASQRQGRTRQRSLSYQPLPSSSPPPCSCPRRARLQQQRPSSAGPVVDNHKSRALRLGSSHDLVLDSSTELLSALSPEERELLEAVTEQGYPLRTAILALEKTGYRNPEKIMSYLAASDRLCELGYEEAQVEEALEMFQNCERKAAEFLRLLAQFNEMGFQQNAIKEVLLVHDNQREKALEELMTRVA